MRIPDKRRPRRDLEYKPGPHRDDRTTNRTEPEADSIYQFEIGISGLPDM